MGELLLLLSLTLVAVSTWKWMGMVKQETSLTRRRKVIWGLTLALGISLFFFLKLFEDRFI